MKKRFKSISLIVVMLVLSLVIGSVAPLAAPAEASAVTTGFLEMRVLAHKSARDCASARFIGEIWKYLETKKPHKKNAGRQAPHRLQETISASLPYAVPKPPDNTPAKF